MHESRIDYGFDVRTGNASNLPGFVFPDPTVNPTQHYQIGILVQPRRFRYKQLYLSVDGLQWNKSGNMFTTALFWDNGGMKVFELPLTAANSSTTLYTRTNHCVITQALPIATGWFYNWNDQTGGNAGSQFNIEIEILCDYITLETSFDTNQWGAGPHAGLMISRASTHPRRMYHEHNFETFW